MYIVKNALKSISRSLGRNILIGIIVLVIAAAACVGLSIRRAAEKAGEDAAENLNITAQISMDMSSMMENSKGESGEFNREDFGKNFENMQSLSLEDLQKYSKAESVDDFYYTLTLNLNASGDLQAVTNELPDDLPDDIEESINSESGGKGGRFDMMSSSDFTVIGYSSEDAMTDFISGVSSITDGKIFTEQTKELDCVISSELATFNSLEVGSEITLCNPDNEEEIYTLSIVGIYESTGGETGGFSRGSFGASDPSNCIYISANAANTITESSADTNEDSDTALTSAVSGTYVFSSLETYEKFEDQARALGLSEDYTVSSSDVSSYEQSLVPLQTLSTFAKYFLIIVLIIGAVILVVINLFNIRERKYEVGVLTAVGMKKRNVAAQFLCEIFIISIAAVVIGAGIGAVSSVPITNALLQNQIESGETAEQQTEQSFGRGEMSKGGMDGGETPDMPDGGSAPDMPEQGGSKGGMFGNMRENTANYISEINSATDFTVLWQLLLIGVVLSLIAGAVSVIFIMRYDPLKILANRD